MTADELERINAAAAQTPALLNQITEAANKAAEALDRLADMQAKCNRRQIANPDYALFEMMGKAFQDAMRKRK